MSDERIVDISGAEVVKEISQQSVYAETLAPERRGDGKAGHGRSAACR